MKIMLMDATKLVNLVLPNDVFGNYWIVNANKENLVSVQASEGNWVLKSNSDVKVFIYHHIREEEQAFYGFNTLEEKELFLRLMSVKGVGPKLVMPMLATGSVKGIIDAIDRENILYLKKFPKVGDKVARQIILDLKGKLMSNEEIENNSVNEELASVLEGLGYKMIDIKKIIPNIDGSLPIEIQVKEALKLLLK